MPLSLAPLAVVETHPPALGVAAVVAPYGDDGGGAFVEEFARRGWTCVAVTTAAPTRPPAFADAAVSGEYRQTVQHEGNLPHTLQRLKAHRVGAVVAGSAVGAELADRLAHGLRLPGGRPTTSLLRRDRGAQAAALALARIPAPRGLRTKSLTEALRWAEAHQMPEYVIAPAAASVTGAQVCRTPHEVSTAWREQRRAAHRHAGDQHLVIQEYLAGPQYLVRSVTGPSAAGAPEHHVTEIWSDVRVGRQVPDQARLIRRSSVLFRALQLYTQRALHVLGVQAGAGRSRIAYVPDRGPVLLSTRVFPCPAVTDPVLLERTGRHTVRDAVQAAIAPRSRPAHRHKEPHVTRLSLIAPQDGAIDGGMLRMITSRSTVARVLGPLAAGSPVTRTVDRATSPGSLVLVADSQRAIDEDCRVIRAVETMGLYQAAVR